MAAHTAARSLSSAAAAAGSAPSALKASKVVVFGGAGFVGRAVCRLAVQHGFEVVSITRSGLPPSDRPWTHKVQWIAGNALEPATFEAHVDSSTAIVHSMGLLLEKSTYKKFITSSPSTHSAEPVTYEEAHLESALRIAEVAARKQASSMVYVSAAGAPPGIDKRYISTKREAETALLAYTSPRAVVVRPGFIYSEESPRTLALAVPMLVSDGVLGYLPPLQSLLRSSLRSHDLTIGEPTALHVLATAIIQAVRAPHTSGVFDNQGIQRLADEAF